MAKLCRKVCGLTSPCNPADRAWRLTICQRPIRDNGRPDLETNTAPVSGLRANQGRAVSIEVDGQCQDGLRAERHPPFLVSFADAPGRSRLEVEVDRPESDDLRGAAAGRIQGFQGGAVASAQPRVALGDSSSDRPPPDPAPSADGPRPTGRPAAWPHCPAGGPRRPESGRRWKGSPGAGRRWRAPARLEQRVDISAQSWCIQAGQRARSFRLTPAHKPHEVRPIGRQACEARPRTPPSSNARTAPPDRVPRAGRIGMPVMEKSPWFRLPAPLEESALARRA